MISAPPIKSALLHVKPRVDFVLSEVRLLKTPTTRRWVTCFELTSGGKSSEHDPSDVVEKKARFARSGGISKARFLLPGFLEISECLVEIHAENR